MTNKLLEGYGFTIAQVAVDKATDQSKLRNLLVREVTGKPYSLGGKSQPPALAKATQPFAESGGVWNAKGDLGVFTYRFTNTLTLPADPSLTTMVSLYAYRDGRASVANDVYTFVPAGGSPKVTRGAVSTRACQTSIPQNCR